VHEAGELALTDKAGWSVREMAILLHLIKAVRDTTKHTKHTK